MKNQISNVADLNTKVTYRKTKYSKDSRAMSIGFILGNDGLLSANNPYASRLISWIENIRTTAAREVREHTDDSRSSDMKEKLPVWNPSGLFNGGQQRSDLKSFSGLICIDIDTKCNNLTEEAIKNRSSQWPYSWYVGRSCRSGVFVLVRVPMDAVKIESDRVDYSAFYAHFKAIQRAFEDMGIVIDPSCSNVNRGRFLSYDPNPYWNLDAKVFTDKVEEPEHRYNSPTPLSPDAYRERNFKRVDSIITKAERLGIDIAPTELAWFSIGRAFASEFGEDGRSFFLRISDLWARVNNRQHEIDPDKEYNDCLTYPGNIVNIGKFFAVTRDFGLTAMRGEY